LLSSKHRDVHAEPILFLQNNNAELQEEVSLLNSKLEGMNKTLRMLNNGSNLLDEILEAGNKSRSMKGLGFDSESTNK